jgi:hypothetical protein
MQPMFTKREVNLVPSDISTYKALTHQKSPLTIPFVLDRQGIDPFPLLFLPRVEGRKFNSSYDFVIGAQGAE